MNDVGLFFWTGLILLGVIVLFMSVTVIREYERAVVFLLGRFQRVMGPGLFLLIPVVQQMVKVDLRTRVLDVPPQDIISKDNVSVQVSAIVYYRIVDPAHAIIEVQQFDLATSQLAQTTLRSILGQHDLDSMLAERDRLNAGIQEILDQQTGAWGIKVSSVEIKNIDLNPTMIQAIAKQAEAERLRRAKVINAEGEFQAAERLRDAAKIIATEPGAMQLRYLATLSEIASDRSNTIVFPFPTELRQPLQRIGRANHRLDEPSQAALVPANRFEVLECIAAQDALAEHTLDGGALFPGGFDVLAQHLTGVACAGAFDADVLYAEVRTAAPFADLARADFDAVLAFVATGGYALATYDRYRRLAKGEDGLWRLSDPKLTRQYRMNIGTIVEAPVMRVRLGRGKALGEVEEYFVSMLTPGDSFLFAGRLLEFQGIRNNEVIAGLAQSGRDPKIPAYAGGKLPLTTHLADRVRQLLADPSTWHRLPQQVGEWLAAQARRSQLTASDELLVETFARGARHYLVAYCFAGRNAHQTLGMLLTRRMERRGLRPLGFVASDYCIATWGAAPVEEVEELFAVEMLGDDLEEWMAESSLIKRTFRNCAVVAGLIERRHPGQEKTGRQVTFSADLIYDVLRKYDPDHVLLRAARAEAAAGLTDIRRLADLLVAVEGPHPPRPARPHLALRGLDHRRHRQGVRLRRDTRRIRLTRRWRSWSRRPWRTSTGPTTVDMVS